MIKPAIVDTDILSKFLRGNEKVKANFRKYLENYESINISIISFYEIISGLKHKDAKRQLSSFLEFTQINNIILLSIQSAAIAGDIYADLRKKGQPLDDIDLLIAGIAIEHDFVLVTHNKKHFSRIENLAIEDWTE